MSRASDLVRCNISLSIDKKHETRRSQEASAPEECVELFALTAFTHYTQQSLPIDLDIQHLKPKERQNNCFSVIINQILCVCVCVCVVVGWGGMIP